MRISLCIYLLICGAVSARLFAAEESASKKPLPRELALPMKQARAAYDAGRYDETIRILSAYSGSDHPVRFLLIGHAESRRNRWPEAIRAYQEALRMDESYRAAGIALAQACVRLEKWADALKTAGLFINPEHGQADEILFYAQAAYQARDLRLCAHLTRRALERFPADDRIRRFDLVLLCEEGAWKDASQSSLALLDKTPVDADLWNQYAYAAQSSEAPVESSAALEAAWLSDPGNPDRLRQYLSSQLAIGHPQTVLVEGDKLLAENRKTETFGDPATMLLLIRAADAAADDARLENWLALVPKEKQTRDMLLCAARSALRRNDSTAARAALRMLIENGKADAAVFLWAGSLAEESGDQAEAEAHFRQAKSLPGGAARFATLRLIRLLRNMKRTKEAKDLLSAYLKEYPEDTSARAIGMLFHNDDSAGNLK
jgi:predicted Zn-dependent protease